MPIVPQYDKQIREAASPNVKIASLADVESFGGGQSLQNVSNAFISYIEEEKRKADDIATTEAYTKAITAKNNLLNDPNSGLVTIKGKNAIGAAEKYQNMFNEQMDAIEKTLTNSSQKEVFSKIRMKHAADFNNDLQKHVYYQTQEYDNETTKAAIEAAKNDAILNYQNKDAIINSKTVQIAAIEAYGERNGVPKEAIELQKKEAISQIHDGILERMINNNEDLLAKAYFEEAKKEMLSDTIIKYEKLVTAASSRAEAQNYEDTIINMGKSYADSLEEARKIQNPEIRDDVVSRIKRRFQEIKNIEEEKKEQNFKKAADILEKTKSRFKIPLNIWESLSISEKEAIEKRERQLIEGVPTKTDYKIYDKLSRAAANDANNFSRMNILQYRSKLSDSDLEKFIDLQRSIREKKTGWDVKQDGFRTEYQIASGMADKLNIDDKNKSDFYSDIENAKREFISKNKREPLRMEFTKIVDDIAINKVFVRKFGFDPEKSVYALNEDEKSNAYVPIENIPQSAIDEIKEQAKSRKVKLTTNKVEEIYGAMLLNDDARLKELLK